MVKPKPNPLFVALDELLDTQEDRRREQACAEFVAQRMPFGPEDWGRFRTYRLQYYAQACKKGSPRADMIDAVRAVIEDGLRHGLPKAKVLALAKRAAQAYR